jgi:hypothetical protein
MRRPHRKALGEHARAVWAVREEQRKAAQTRAGRGERHVDDVKGDG